MDTSYNNNAGLTTPSSKQSPLMQFQSEQQDPLLTKDNKLNGSNNNNSNDNLFSVQGKCSVETNVPNRGPDFQSVGSSSPQLSSTSSVSSHAQNNDDCDAAFSARNSSPSSPQSSYNSSYGSNSGRKLMNNSSNSITSQVPGGVVTTQNISTVIRPKGNNNSLQFVKIQPPDLSKKAVEQIRIAQETKISKDKIKEVEEEWQSNLLNWKSKRRQQFSHTIDHEPNNSFDANENGSGRKIKTFAEMMEQRAKSGNRLGFHLQRYIGADDEDDNQPTRPKEERTDEFEQLENRADSDCEAQSSVSSGYNNPDSKSLVSFETPVDIPNAEDSSKSLDIHALESDNGPNSNPCDEKDSHTISIVENSESNQLNSTLKQGMEQPNQAVSTLAQPAQNVGLKSNNYAEINDESDNSAFEEEEEELEEEEQKHLQRVAFVAKLKAFENLTKPTSQKPAFAQSRGIPKPRVPKDKLPQFPKDERPQVPKDRLSQAPKGRLPQVPQNIHPQVPKDELPQVPRDRLPQAPKVRLPQVPQSIHPQVPRDDMLQSPKGRLPQITQNILPQVPKDELPQVPKDRLPKVPQNILHQVPIDELPQIPQNILPQVPKDELPQAPKDRLILPRVDSALTDRPKLSEPKVVQRVDADSPRVNPSPRKPVKEDKDRTVLSVSGKKRCSSCKEELGRGAAAFVVESLSLVYHTNCFRCSVCHVNLSNGFRGVDVRVHAGALHCQNCYSKDGLNYSRV